MSMEVLKQKDMQQPLHYSSGYGSTNGPSFFKNYSSTMSRDTFRIKGWVCHTSDALKVVEGSDARLFSRNKQVNLKNKPKTGNLPKNKPNIRWHKIKQNKKISKKIK